MILRQGATGLLGLMIAFTAISPALSDVPEGPDAVRAAMVERQCRSAIEQVADGGAVSAYEAQIAGAIETSGADLPAIRIGLNACAAGPGVPKQAIAAIRALLSRVALNRVRQTGGVGETGNSPFSNPPGFTGSGGSDYSR